MPNLPTHQGTPILSIMATFSKPLGRNVSVNESQYSKQGTMSLLDTLNAAQRGNSLLKGLPHSPKRRPLPERRRSTSRRPVARTPLSLSSSSAESSAAQVDAPENKIRITNEERLALLRSFQSKYASPATGSEAFAARKAEEIALEDRHSSGRS